VYKNLQDTTQFHFPMAIYTIADSGRWVLYSGFNFCASRRFIRCQWTSHPAEGKLGLFGHLKSQETNVYFPVTFTKLSILTW